MTNRSLVALAALLAACTPSAEEGSTAAAVSPIPYVAPFASTGDKPLLRVPAVGANGHALSWDGRLAILTSGIAPTITITATPAGSFAVGHLTLDSGQSVSAGKLVLVMQGDCNVVLYDTSVTPSAALWSTGTAGKCTHGRLTFQGDGNLVLGDVDKNVALWSSGTNPWGATLDVFATSPFVAIASSSGAFGWDSTSATKSGWTVRVFRPEYLGTHPSTDLATVATNLNASFSSAYPWGIPDGTPPADFSKSQVLAGLPALNALAITPRPGFAENPYRSDAAGSAVAAGAYLTYQMTIITEYYPADSAPPYLMTMPVTAIVQSPYTVDASIYSVQATAAATPLTDTTGARIYGIEPSATFDGELVLFQRFGSGVPDGGHIYYIANAAAGLATGWSVPRSITTMNADATMLKKGYPLARYPMRDAYGNPYTGSLPGAYVWVSPEGADLFISAVTSQDGARRAATSLIGAGTKGMLRQVDGAPNINRTGIGSPSGIARLFVSSLGLSPGMWSPLEFQPTQVLPLTDKRNTYPMFSSNSGAYFEVSEEETLAGGYDAYLDMAEVITQQATYDTNATQDLSGNFHDGAKNAGALFAEEAYPSLCSSTVCTVTDPSAPGVNLFSGKAMYFEDSGLVTVAAKSQTGHQLLVGAQDLTASVAVMPMQDLSRLPNNQYRMLVSKTSSFNLILEANRTISGTVNVVVNDALVTLRSTFVGTALPLNAWSHVAMTYTTATATMQIFVDGVLASTQVFANPGAPLNVDVTQPLVVGPVVGGSVSGLVYALDQVGVSRVVRSPQEIARQATLVFPRTQALPNALPVGIQPKDVRSPILALRALDPKLVTLGHDLFFDRLLSPDNDVACVTCHTPASDLTEPVALHASRILEVGQAPHVLRNTPALSYLGLSDQFFFDGRAATLVAQAHTVLGNPVEMGPSADAATARVAADAKYPALFAAAFPNGVTTDNVGAALQEFELSLMTDPGVGGSRFDRFATTPTVLSAQEREGRALFFGKARCAQCHTGSVFSDASFHTLPFLQPANEDGVVDHGRRAVTGLADDDFKFATPSLRNVALTAPYFHDGSSATLSAVVDRYRTVGAVSAVNTGIPEPLLLPIDLTDAERDALVAFLSTLTSSPTTPTTPTYTTPRTAAPASTSYPTGSSFAVGTRVRVDGETFTVQGDANLVVYDNAGTPVWASGTAGRADCTKVACKLVMQGDGNLVFYAGSTPIWESGTASTEGPFPGTQFVVSSTEPYLRVLDAEGSIVWASSNRFSSLLLKAGQFVRVGPIATASYLVMQGDENLVYYGKVTTGAGYSSPGFSITDAKWATGTSHANAPAGSYAAFQGDGNLVVYTAGGTSLWASQTYTEGRQWLTLAQTNPYITIETSASTLTFSAP